MSSTILDSAPAPFLGKRKDTDPCRSLFAGESKLGPKATKEKEASDGKELGESKCCPEATKEEEASDGKELGLCEWMRACQEKLLEAIANGEIEEGDGEEEDDDEPCEICKKKGHWHLRCPWKLELPFGAVPPGIPSEYMVWCKACEEDEFEEKTGNCAKCGSRYKFVHFRTCRICWKRGHSDNTDKNCPLYGKEVTRENPLRKLFYSGLKTQ